MEPAALPWALSSADCRSCIEYCWIWADAPSQDLWHVAAEDRLEAGEVHRALVLQLPPEGADRRHHIMGLRQERWVLGTRTFLGPDGPGASTSMVPLTAFDRWSMSWVWRRQKSLMARLRSAAVVAQRWPMSFPRAAASLSSSSHSWLCVAGRDPW